MKVETRYAWPGVPVGGEDEVQWWVVLEPGGWTAYADKTRAEDHARSVGADAVTGHLRLPA